MKKKLLSCILAICTMLAYLPAFGTTAYAGVNVAKILETGEEYDSVQAAIGEVSTGQTIQMLTDSSENLTPEGKNFILDLNGKVLSAPEGGGCVILLHTSTIEIKDSNSSAKHYFKVATSGLWEIQSGTLSANYTFDASNGLRKNGIATNDIPAANSIIAVSGGCITGGTGQDVYGDRYGGAIYYSTGGDNTKVNLTSGNIVGNTSKLGGGIYSHLFIMNGGAICGNIADSGGGVYGASGYNVSLNGGIVAYNTATNGGGVYNMNGTLNILSSSKISFNTAEGYGGGVYNGYNAILNGGIISGNVSGVKGGGIYNFEGGFSPRGPVPGAYFTMTGGTVSGNKSPEGGGVVYGESVIIGGKSIISGNTLADGITANNLYIPSEKKVVVGTTEGDVPVLSKGANIGVTTAELPKEGEPVEITTNGSTDDVNYFVSDNIAYGTKYNTDHIELVFLKAEPKKDDPTNTGGPINTGDSNNLVVFAWLLMLSAIGLAACRRLWYK